MSSLYRRMWQKKSYGNGSHYSHGLGRKLKVLAHRHERRHIRELLRREEEDVAVTRFYLFSLRYLF